VHDTGEEDGLLYLVMFLARDGTLKNQLRSSRPPPWAARRVLQLAQQILPALDAAHQKGIIHRDIKPDNILLHGDRSFLSDFGIAKLMQGDPGLTAVGMFVGTPEYAAPEQVLGLPPDGRSDLYAFGVVLYELLVGHVPYQGDTPLSVAVQHVQASLPSPAEANPALADPIADVVVTALAKAPDQRYPTGDAMVVALEAAVREAEDGASEVGRMPDATLEAVEPHDSHQDEVDHDHGERPGLQGRGNSRPLVVVSSDPGSHRIWPIIATQMAFAAVLQLRPRATAAPPKLTTGAGVMGVHGTGHRLQSAVPRLATAIVRVRALSGRGVPKLAAAEQERAASAATVAFPLRPRVGDRSLAVVAVLGTLVAAVVLSAYLAGRAAIPEATQDTGPAAAAQTSRPVVEATVVPEPTSGVVLNTVQAALPTSIPTSTPTPSAELEIEAAQAALGRGRFEEAISILTVLRQRDSTNATATDELVRAHLSYGAALLEANDYDGSESQYDAVLQLNPGQPDAMNGEQQVLLARDWDRMNANWSSDAATALSAAEEIYRLDSGYRDIGEKLYALLIARSDNLQDAGNHEEALSTLLEALTVSPSNGAAQERLAQYTPTARPTLPPATATLRPAQRVAVPTPPPRQPPASVPTPRPLVP
jgi:tetratricopeptide (TPR) repeat protein